MLERAAIGAPTINLLGWAGGAWPVPAATMIVLLLFVAASGKSAQVPMHVWLPFAMEAPTPVSALIHAATMVNAGPFLLIRISPLLVLSPVVMGVIAVVGATTALFAAVVSATQSDIKKILAYSTISQIGFMIMMCGVGAFAAALFHLLAHGFLKAFLFLSTGNALAAVTPHHEHEPHAPHDAPATGAAPRSWELAAGTLLFACVPPLMLFSGPYERDVDAAGHPRRGDRLPGDRAGDDLPDGDVPGARRRTALPARAAYSAARWLRPGSSPCPTR